MASGFEFGGSSTPLHRAQRVGFQDTGDLYSRVALYSDCFAFLQFVAIFEPCVGGERAPCGLTFHDELASLVHCDWILHWF